MEGKTIEVKPSGAIFVDHATYYEDQFHEIIPILKSKYKKFDIVPY